MYLTLSPRPPRLGVFVPMSADMPWERCFEMALAAQSRLWGGSANLLFPSGDEVIDNELFWALADGLDADYFASASFSASDLSSVSPSWFAEWRSSLEQAMERDAPDVSEAGKQRFIEEQSEAPIFRFDMPNDLVDVIKRRLAPFHRNRELRLSHDLCVDSRRPPGESAQYPFADVTQLKSWPQRIVNPATSLGPLHQLLLTAEAGRLPAGFAEAVVDAGLAEVEPEARDDGPAWRRALFQDLPEDVAYPLTLAEHGLQWYQRGFRPREGATVVAGDTAWDFSLFYALRRWTTTAYWLPQPLMKEVGFLPELCNALLRIVRRWGGVVKVVTASDEAFRDQVAATLGTTPPFAVRARGADWREVLPDQPNRLLERDNPGRAQPVARYEGRTVELPTPIPALARTRGHAELRWVTDVRGHGWAPIRHGAVGTAVIDDPGLGSEHARTSRDGVAYTSAGWATWSGVSLEMGAVRPLLRPRSLIEQLGAALDESGWSCASSDKGAYAAESAVLFGGFRAIAAALLNRDIRVVLEAFRDQHAPGKKAGDRRYLTLDDLEKVVCERNAAEAVCADLSARSVLTPGLFLKCSRCRRAGWYGLAEVTTSFICRRCRTEQRVGRDAWLGTVEPTWHYELAEVVYEMLKHHGELPILAVAQAFPRADAPGGRHRGCLRDRGLLAQRPEDGNRRRRAPRDEPLARRGHDKGPLRARCRQGAEQAGTLGGSRHTPRCAGCTDGHVCDVSSDDGDSHQRGLAGHLAGVTHRGASEDDAQPGHRDERRQHGMRVRRCARTAPGRRGERQATPGTRPYSRTGRRVSELS